MFRIRMRERVSETDPGGLSPEARRTERTIALIRIAVTAVVAAVYLSSIGIEHTLGPLALSILVLAALYSLWALLARPYETRFPGRYRAATLIVDAALITLWCEGTGGPRSEFWTLYLLVLIAVAMRFDLMETLASAVGVALLYVVVMSVDGGLTRRELLVRPALMLIIGFGVGVLAWQRRVHQDQREAAEIVAEERGLALAEEHATVEQLRRVDMAKSEFVAVASHEFRAPLAGILGVLSTLRSRGETLDLLLRDELLEGAIAQASRLARLVDDLLTVSRIEDGALRPDVQAASPAQLAIEAAQASGTVELLDFELAGVRHVDCDADQIVRVLANLLDNARKYSPAGTRIVLAVNDLGTSVRFCVRDHGPGVPPEYRASVFERFQRVDDAPHTPGAGLGLYICRCLVEAHGGTISVDEAPGGGAEFSFTLPKLGGGTGPAASTAEPRPSRVAVK
jgi:signal transduction histidine kinase